jgi:tetratricopeptide (TPR) repeat protein
LVPCVLFVLSGCASPPKANDNTDITLVQFSTSAQQAFELGSYERAARFYELALDRAWAIDDGPEVANNAFNLAAVDIVLGRLDEADAVLVAALGEFERLNRNTADVLLLQSRVAQARGDAARSGALLDEAMQMAKSDDARLQAWILKADLACDAGDLALAEKNLAEAQSLFDATKDDALRAGVARVSGRVYQSKEQPAQAAEEFDREAAFQQKAHRYPEMARALDRAGQAYQAAGNHAGAADRWYRASRSRYAQKDAAGALKLIDAAMKAATDSGQKGLQGQVSALFEMIREDVDAASAPRLAR